MSRRRCSVVDLEIEQKLEKRYDEEEKRGTHRKVLEWINNCLVNEYDFLFCGSYSWKEIQKFLEDGMILCRLMNRLLVQAGHPKLDYKIQQSKKYDNTIWTENAKENVALYNEGALKLGVNEMYLIDASDLLNGRKGHMFNIVVAIHHLGLVANEKGLTPSFEKPKHTGRKLSIVNIMNGRHMLELIQQMGYNGVEDIEDMED